MRSTLALAAAVAGIALFPAGATALPTPTTPLDCNFMTVKGKRYNIKADQMSCAKARKLSQRLLSGGRAKGFTCQKNPTEQTRFYCHKGNSVFFYVNKRF